MRELVDERMRLAKLAALCASQITERHPEITGTQIEVLDRYRSLVERECWIKIREDREAANHARIEAQHAEYARKKQEQALRKAA